MIGYMVKGACIGIMFQAVLAVICAWTYQPYVVYVGWLVVTIGLGWLVVFGVMVYGDDH